MAITQPPYPVSSEGLEQPIATRNQGEMPGAVMGQPYGQGQEFNLRDILDLVMRRWPWMIATLLVVVTLGMAYTITRPKLYASTTEMAIPQSNKGPFGGMEDLPGLDQLKDFATSRTVDTQMRMLQSKDFIRAAFEALPVETQQQCGMKPPEVALTNAKNSNVIALTVTARSPKIAAAMANSMVDVFIQRDLEENRAAISTALAYIAGEQQRIGGELTGSRKRLAEFEAANRVPNVDGTSANTVADDLATLESTVDAVENDAALARETLRLLNAKMTKEEKDVVTGATTVQDPQVAKFKEEIADLEGRRTQLLVEYVPDAPAVRKVEALIQATRDELSEYLSKQAARRAVGVDPALIHEDLQKQYIDASAKASAAESRLGVLRAKLDEKRAELSKAPALRMRATELESEVKQYEATFASLTQSYQTLRISEASKLSNVRLINAAAEDPNPVSPKVARNAALFVILGLLLAAGLAVLLESLDDRIHTQEHVQRLTNQPILAHIPMVPEGATPQLTDGTARNSSVLEGMRLLRSNLTFTSIDRAAQIIAVTSSGAGEGKSTTAINLAVALAMDGKRVVMVDADLRRPSLHNYFRLSRAIGLTSVITGQASLAEALQTTAVEGITLLSTGPLPPNPPEVLNSQQTRKVIADLSGQFDIVIIDTPPAAGLSDTAIIATMVQGVLMVISANQTQKGQLRVALNTLEQVDAPLLGFIFNKISGSQGGYGYYYYYYYYQKYYTTEGEENGARKKRKRRGRK